MFEASFHHAQSRRRHPVRWFVLAGLAAVGVLGTWLVAEEVQTSQVQAGLFAEHARRLSYRVEDDPNPAARVPLHGPYDIRAGYVALPETIRDLDAQGYEVHRQARLSPALERHMALGGIAVYSEKPSVGLDLRDSAGKRIYQHRTPATVFKSFEEIPDLIVETLLFIENRELMSGPPSHNPAIEWDRLAAAALNQLSPIPFSELAGGGSTLATQMEKFRHSPDGRTSDAAEKLRQLFAASLRAYADGPDTRASRQRIVVDYLNATPLAGRAGYGEVIGLPEALAVWFGLDPDIVAEVLAAHRACQMATGHACPAIETVAELYKPVLALLLAQRRPSYYLTIGIDDLRALVDRYIGVLNTAGVLDTRLADAVRVAPLTLSASIPARPETGKTARTVRTNLAALVGADSLYALDRLDLQANSTLNLDVQTLVSAVLLGLSDPAVAEAHGLTGPSVLGPGLEKVVYALQVMERTADGNVVRIDVDTLSDQPFQVGNGAKLDLGSTAKLRTLVTYLQLIEAVYDQLSGPPRPDQETLAKAAPDRLTRWVAGRFVENPAITRQAMLEAALTRSWSASPGEAFFTGGGLHRFANFDRRDNERTVTLAEAFSKSINLPFIRVMREVSEHLRLQLIPDATEILDNADHPARATYLKRFARAEGTVFLRRYYAQLQGRNNDDLLSAAADLARPRATGYAALMRDLRPTATPAEVYAFATRELARRGRPAPVDTAERLFNRVEISRFGLNDRAYVAGLHPLALWLTRHLDTDPVASWDQVRANADDVLLESYAWLFKVGRKKAQDRRIQTVLEQDAFAEMQRLWAALGYPFETLVPSLATAVGASADRPSALADLMGILSNDGVRLPTVRFSRLHFGANTPFETDLAPAPDLGTRVISRDVARVTRAALSQVVAAGTAKRIDGAFNRLDGTSIPIAGKTGTGDSRHETVTRNGTVVASRMLARTATFAFILGDKHFGVISAYVSGEDAATQRFTSALPTQVLRIIAPTLRPLLDPEPTADPEMGPTIPAMPMVSLPPSVIWSASAR